MPKEGKSIKAVIYMFGALISFCLMAVAARELSGKVDTFIVLFFRSLIGFLTISFIIVSMRKKVLLSTKRAKLHIVRNTFHLAGQYGWLVGIGLLPLFQVFALEFTVPIWTLLFACFFLGESMTGRKIMSISLGFLGVLLIVRPGFEVLEYGSLIVLLAAIFYSISHVATKSLSSTESALTIVFYMNAIQLPIGAILSYWVWKTPEGVQWVWLTVVAMTSLCAHFCISKAMNYADASVVVTFDFLRLPAIALVGAMIYSEKVGFFLFLGAAFMIIGNLINIYRAGDVANRKFLEEIAEKSTSKD
ncbi:DMT family transporter [Enterovibrio norvegicus]|uniref:DMT family transporter n=1 Tax=Enterovibrio norvegicus TaxID=188144 RepID=UPI0002DE2607|nr:DMT family transporter [Enterovibrio norvegicus]